MVCMKRLSLLITAGALLGVALLACAGGATKPAQNESAETLRQRLRALEAAAACKVPADCRTLPIGERLCGGPETWLAMSAAQMGEAKTLAERYNALRKEANKKLAEQGVAGTCEVAVEPGVNCVAGYCRTQASGPGGRVD